MALIYGATHLDGDDHYTGGYQKYPFHTVRAQISRGRWQSLLTQKILVAGCGYGYLVEELIAQGFTDVWGCDASLTCVSRASTRINPAIAPRIVQANCLVRGELNNLRSVAGLGGNARFRVIITEDLLTCLTQAEIATCLTELRRIGQELAHVVTPKDDWVRRDRDGNIIPSQRPEYTWLTLAEWRTLIGPNDAIWDASTNMVAP